MLKTLFLPLLSIWLNNFPYIHLKFVPLTFSVKLEGSRTSTDGLTRSWRSKHKRRKDITFLVTFIKVKTNTEPNGKLNMTCMNSRMPSAEWCPSYSCMEEPLKMTVVGYAWMLYWNTKRVTDDQQIDPSAQNTQRVWAYRGAQVMVDGAVQGAKLHLSSQLDGSFSQFRK